MQPESGPKRWIELKPKEADYDDFGRRIFADFLTVISKGKKPLVSASDVLASMELIDECYEAATRFNMPWYEALGVLNGR